MEYKKIKSHKMTEAELRKMWFDEYCNPSNPVLTFDGIMVKFYSEMFDHAFYESANRMIGDKSILSLNRCEKMLWIKATLQDSSAILKQGWIKEGRRYDNKRRVALVKDNYVVIILIYAISKARFITAFQIDNDDNLENFMNGPNWVK